MSDDALAGWAASTHRVYTVVGGCFISICMDGYLVAHVSHVSALFLDHFHEGLKGMDYWKLLREFGEPSCLCFFGYFYCLVSD
jgi:hypothetical protein